MLPKHELHSNLQVCQKLNVLLGIRVPNSLVLLDLFDGKRADPKQDGSQQELRLQRGQPWLQNPLFTDLRSSMQRLCVLALT